MESVEVGELLDELTQQLNQSHSHEAAMSYWKHFLALDRWHFVTAMPEGGSLPSPNQTPVLTFRDGESRMVAIYTDSARASRAARASGMADESGASAVIEMGRESAMSYVCSMWPEVDRFLVNQVPGDTGGYGNRIPDLATFYDHVVGALPIQCLDAIAVAANESGHPNAYLAAYRSIAQQEHVFMGIQGNAPSCVPVGDSLAVAVFSSEDRASAIKELNPEFRVAPAKPAQVPDLIRQVETASDGKVRGGVLNLGTTPIGLNPELFAKACGTNAGN